MCSSKQKAMAVVKEKMQMGKLVDIDLGMVSSAIAKIMAGGTMYR